MSNTISTSNYNPKFFDTNTIESVLCTRTEPTAYMTGTGDLIDNIRDGRSNTNVTLTPSFSTASIKPDGNMDTITGWTASTGASIATDSSIFIAGSSSIKFTFTNIGSYSTCNMSKTFTAFDMSSNKLLWLGLYATSANEAVAPVNTVKITLTDNTSATAVKYMSEMTGTSPLDATYWSDKWLYLTADFTGATGFDFTNVVGIKIEIAIALIVGTPTPYFNLDGLRLGPADCVFLYDYSQAVPFHLAAINGLNCLRYSLDASVNGTSWTNLANAAAFAESDIMLFNAVNWAVYYYAHIRLTISFVTQTNGAVGTTVANLLLLPFLYEWDNAPKSIPTKENTITTAENDLGAMTVNKIGTVTKINMSFDMFEAAQAEDLVFVETLGQRITPLWLWLNGNNADTTFVSQGSPWKYANVFYIYDATQNIPLGHVGGIADLANPTNGLTINLVEAAYKRTGV